MNKIKHTIIQKISWISSGVIAGLFLVVWQISPAGARVKTLASKDVGNQELRALTVESWDRDYSGAGYGWRVITNRDSKDEKVSQYKFKTDSIQVEREVKLLKGTPVALRENLDNEEARVLGVHFTFTFPGRNIVTLMPPDVDHYTNERIRHYLSENAATEKIPNRSCFKNSVFSIQRKTKRAYVLDCINGVNLPGRVHKISIWAMGRGNNYNLEFWVEDWRGNAHVLKAGSLNFIGWRPLSVNVPRYIHQDTNTFPRTKTLILTKMKIRSTSSTFPDPVYLFFDELKILAEVFQVNFDGAQFDFDAIDCERKNSFYRSLRRGSRVPEQWPKIVDCRNAPGPASPINQQQ